MQIKKILVSVLLAQAFLFSAPSVITAAEIIDKVAIVVNEDIVTDREIERQLAPIYQRYKVMYSGAKLIQMLEDAKQQVAQQMIEDRLLYGEAKKQGIVIDEKEVDAKVQEIVNNMGSKEIFDRALLEQQLTVKDLKERYRQQFMIRRVIDRKVAGTISVTPVDIETYYKNNKSEFVQPERVKLKSILISISKYPDPSKALNLIKDIHKRLKQGCDFEGLAKTYSDGPGSAEGGEMGYVKRGDLLPEIDQVVFNLKPGEFSGIIQSSLGYHIFKVESKEASKELSLAEVRRDVEAAVYKSKVDAKIKGWIEGMKKSAYIAFK